MTGGRDRRSAGHRRHQRPVHLHPNPNSVL